LTSLYIYPNPRKDDILKEKQIRENKRNAEARAKLCSLISIESIENKKKRKQEEKDSKRKKHKTVST